MRGRLKPCGDRESRRPGALRGILWPICTVLVACGPRPAPTGAGAPIGPRSVAEIQALIGEPALTVGRTVFFGFESEEEFADFYITPSPHLGTTWHERASAAFAGSSSHHAWIDGTNPVIPGENTNHRGYPTVQFQKTAGGPLQGLVLIELMVWLNIELRRQEGMDWFSFVTVTSYGDDFWQRTLLFNVDSDGLTRLMHVPGQQQRILDLFQSDAVFPMREWAKVTMLLDFTSANTAGAPYLKAWVNEQPVSAARFDPRIDPRTVDRSLWPPCLDGWDEQSLDDAEARCGLQYLGGVAQVHLGMYAPPLISRGDVYNDELYFYELERR
jgi:hypothetical protein